MLLEVPSDADYTLYNYVKLFRSLIKCTIWIILGYSTNILWIYNTVSPNHSFVQQSVLMGG